jgi:hypothetical protein
MELSDSDANNALQRYGDNNESNNSDIVYTGSGTPGSSTSIDTFINPSRKVIYTATLDFETLDFDAAVGTVKLLAEQFGGYFESSDIKGGKRGGDEGYYELRNASFIVRIPADNFSDFLDRKGDIGSVFKDVTKAQDVTLQYQDNETRLKSLRLQEERVLEILEKADKLSDVFEIENTLADLRYEIETLTSSQLLLTSQVDYSTAYITLYEVQKITKTKELPLTLSERIAHRFKSTLEDIKNNGEDFLVWLLGDSIVILIWGAFIAAVVLILLKIRKRNLRKKQDISPPAPEANINP